MKKNILFIDDKSNELEYFTNAFRQITGLFHYIYAGSAEKGLSIIKRTPVDLVFVQYNLPEINGLLFLSAVKSFRKNGSLKVYLYSNSISEEESKMAKRLGAAGCLEKTPDNTTFIRELRAILNPELLPDYVFFPRMETARFMVQEDENPALSLEQAVAMEENLENKANGMKELAPQPA